MANNPEFYAKEDAQQLEVWKHDALGDYRVCSVELHIEGAAEQIARALNRLPEAEQLLIRVAQLIASPIDNANELYPLRDEIEEWMVNG